MVESIKPPRVAGTTSAVANPPKSTATGTARETVYKAKIESPAVGSMAEAIMSLGPPIDIAKVTAVRAQIARGEYRLDPASTTSKMLDDGGLKP